MNTGRLLLLPAPLSEDSLDDVLPRGVIETARATRFFLAERAKTARAFLKALEHPVAMQSLRISEIGHEPDPARIAEWLQPALEGHDVALVSEAGCPAVADPGSDIVRYAHERGVPVHPLVGPSAVLLALMASGLDGQHFRFVGYLPQDADDLAKTIVALESASRGGETQLFIETPYRNERLFEALLRACAPGTRLTVAAALTGQDESIATRTIDSWRRLTPIERPSLRNRPAIFALLGARVGEVRKQR